MLSDVMIDKIVAQGSALGYACEIDFGIAGVTRAHTGVGQIILNGQIFNGVGELGGVGMAQANGDTNPTRMELELSGVPSGLMGEALRARARGNPATVYVVVYDKDSRVTGFEVLVHGFITDYVVNTGESNTIGVTIADEFELFQMPWHRYWTDESHKFEQKGDRLCRFASQMEDREIQWGSKNDAPPFRRS